MVLPIGDDQILEKDRKTGMVTEATSTAIEPILRPLDASFAGVLGRMGDLMKKVPDLLAVNVDYKLLESGYYSALPAADYHFAKPTGRAAVKTWFEVDLPSDLRLELADATFGLYEPPEVTDLISDISRACGDHIDLSRLSAFYLPHCVILQAFYLGDHLTQHSKAILHSHDQAYRLPICTVAFPRASSNHSALTLASDLQEDLQRFRMVTSSEYTGRNESFCITLSDITETQVALSCADMIR